MSWINREQRINPIAVVIFFLFATLFSNASLVGPFRFVDLAVLFSFFFIGSFVGIKVVDAFLIFAFMVLGLTSSLTNFENFTNPSDLAFYYKYLFYMIAVVVGAGSCEYSRSVSFGLNSETRVKRGKNCLTLVRILAIFHILFIFKFYFENLGGVLGGSTRVSLPFSTLDSGTSNSPAYSVVIGLIFIFLYEHRRSPFDLMISLFLLIVLLATGSRSGVFCLLFYFAFFKRPFLDKNIFVLFVALLLFLTFFLEQMGDLFGELLTRALNFNLISDQSANDRVFKQFTAIMDVAEKRLFFLGLGHENTEIVWYDGLLGNVLIFGGIFALCILIALVFNNALRIEPKVRMFVLIPFFVSFVSEFILTSYVVGLALFLLLASQEVRNGDRIL